MWLSSFSPDFHRSDELSSCRHSEWACQVNPSPGWITCLWCSPSNPRDWQAQQQSKMDRKRLWVCSSDEEQAPLPVRQPGLRYEARAARFPTRIYRSRCNTDTAVPGPFDNLHNRYSWSHLIGQRCTPALADNSQSRAAHCLLIATTTVAVTRELVSRHSYFLLFLCITLKQGTIC